MSDIVDRHRHACDGFSRLVKQVSDQQWDAPTPCTEWDARALVEHLIGFHDVLLLRPLGVRANRPKTGPAARWEATASALFGALETEGTLERETELPGGGASSPRTMLGALTTDVLVHTWDLARAAGLEADLDHELVEAAYNAQLGREGSLPAGMFAESVAVADDADLETKLIAIYGRDPHWTPGGKARR